MRLLRCSIDLLFIVGSVSAFVMEQGRKGVIGLSSSRRMVGSGPGWDNGSFLDSLGGSDDDQENAEKSYQEFKETRASFLKRQEERMNSEQGRKFMQQQGMMPPQEMTDDDVGMNDSVGGSEPSRFHQMMQQAQAAGRGKRPEGLEWMRGPPGLQQKLAIPLDYDEEEDCEEDSVDQE